MSKCEVLVGSHASRRDTFPFLGFAWRKRFADEKTLGGVDQVLYGRLSARRTD